MVKQDYYEVELINADTKDSFKEHDGPDGKIYAEVEPGAEYFIRVRTNHPHNDKKVVVNFFVDENDLGYQSTLSSGKYERDYGICSQKDGKHLIKALLFEKTPVIDDDKSSQPWTGVVRVEFYEALGGQVRIVEDWDSSWDGGNVGTYLGEKLQKGVKSGVGKTLESVKEVGKRRKTMSYSNGAQLASIELHYCTALGLILANVLPKPPKWEFHRMKHPYKPEDNEEMKKGPQPVSCNLSSTIVVKETQVEVFDLM